MCGSCNVRIDDVWLHLAKGQTYRTPDIKQGVPFTIDSVTLTSISISPQNIQIARLSFSDALHYLRANHHTCAKPCAVESSNNPNSSGPLCDAARSKNSNVRCINYILPILQNHGLVGIDGNQPNTTWIISQWSQ